jgi:hypothetical protein
MIVARLYYVAEVLSQVLCETTHFKNYKIRSRSNPAGSGLGSVLVRSGFREGKTQTGPDPFHLYW